MADTYKVREDPVQGKPSTEVKPAGKLLKETPKPVRPPGTAPEERKLLAERAKPRDPGRLVSLDAYRGFIMFVLAASGFGIAAFAAIDPNSPVWEKADYELWRDFPYEYEKRLPIDVINGGDWLRAWVDDPDAGPEELESRVRPDEAAWLAEREPLLLYR